jgi:cytochrome P450
MATADGTIEERACRFFLFDPELDADPHPTLDEFRAECPVGRSEMLGGFWFVTRREDVHHVLSDWQTFSSRQVTVPDVEYDNGKQIPLGFDPPDLNRYRQMFAPLFGPMVAQRIEESVRERAVRLIESIRERGSCEFVHDFAVPLPGEVFLTLLGVPLDDLEMLLELKERIIRDAFSGDPEKMRYAREVARPALNKYIEDHLDVRASMHDPPDDLLTGYLKARDDEGNALTRAEIIGAVSLLTTAGLDTVTNVLALSWSTLAESPELRRRLAEHPDQAAGAVEEFLRFWSVVNTGRVAAQDTEVGGQPIKAGEFVMTLTSAAGRDPAEFEDPNTIDFARSPNRHLAFGAGPHRCLGSHIARMQLRVALEEWHRLIPEYSLAPGASQHRHFGVLMGARQLELQIG